MDVAAPPSLIWSFLPGIRKRPGTERVPLNDLSEQAGARYDVIYRDSLGKVTRHDRLEVLRWDPGVRFVARVQYQPPGPPLVILYNVDLTQSGAQTHFVMDSYTTVYLPDSPDPTQRAALRSARENEWQQAVVSGYNALKTEIEAAAKKP